jgi:asparagine synthetase B (glutamine-hydrolysing)
VCGILGTYDIAVDAGRWTAMSDALAHRAPDAAGTWTGPDDAERVRLGHRRLSIIDLSAAASQPFVKDGLVLVFNGEIYNYRELRAELGGAGVSFRTGSDTEVLLEAWRRWGPASLRRPARHVRLGAVRRAPVHAHPRPRPLGRLRHEYRRTGDRCHNRRTVILRLWSSR